MRRYPLKKWKLWLQSSKRKVSESLTWDSLSAFGQFCLSEGLTPATVKTYHNYIRRFVIRSAVSKGWLAEEDFVNSYEHRERSAMAKAFYEKAVPNTKIGVCVCGEPVYVGMYDKNTRTGNAKMLCKTCHKAGLSGNLQRASVKGHSKKVARLVGEVPVSVAANILGTSVADVKAILVGMKKATEAQGDIASEALKKISDGTIDRRLIYPDDAIVMQSPWAIRDVFTV
jgi:hypothetical protein